MYLQRVFHGIRLLRLMKRLIVVRQSIFVLYPLLIIFNVQNNIIYIYLCSICIKIITKEQINKKPHIDDVRLL